MIFCMVSFWQKFKKVDRRDRFLIVFSLISTIVSLGAGIVFVFDQQLVEQYTEYGYLGIALINFISDVPPFSPIPASLVTFAATSNSSFDVTLLVLISAIATTVGQAFQYLFGDGIDKLVRDYKWHERLRNLFYRQPFLFLVIWIALPNPIQSLGQIFVGTAEYPIWKYMIAAFIGNCIWFSLVVSAGGWLFSLSLF